MNDFVDIAYVLSYSGMVVIVVFITQALKKLFAKANPQHLALGASIFLCIIAAVLFGEYTTAKEIIETVVTWVLNAFVVWFAAMKAYEQVHSTSTAEIDN